VLAGGLLFTGLLGVLLLVITGRAVRIEELVAERTDELERANQELRRHIDEVKRAEEELERQARELARSNRELEQFAYVASHDLQEPLRMVGSYTELLAQRYPEKRDAETDEFIGYVLEGVMRMQALIRDLLSYSRVGSQAQPFVATDCGEVLQRALANLRSAIDDSGAEVTIGGLPVVGADPSQMLQLFQNLVGNAVKFHGEERPLIRVGAERRGADWVFSVTDNGIGIDARYADRIFVIFQRLHGRGKYPGTGIGLAICKKIVERHAGRIWVESQPGKGATFYFTIPAIPG
jgi:hypothetical protein